MEHDATVPYKGFRFPAEAISHAVWPHHRFPGNRQATLAAAATRSLRQRNRASRSGCGPPSNVLAST